jgi:hypothetical protein
VSTLIVFLTNGRRECLPKAVHSFLGKVHISADDEVVIVDDSGDVEYRAWLTRTFRHWKVSRVGEYAMGYNAAMLHIWDLARCFDHVFMVEDDFVFDREVNLADMIDALEDDEDLAQIVLLRQAWFGNEVDASGLIPALVNQGKSFKVRHTNMGTYLSHRATWSTNPNLFRGGSWVENHPWPIGEGSEYRFGQHLFQTEPETVCAYWGDGTEYVTHTGERKGFGY